MKHIILYKNHGTSIGYWEGSADASGLVTMRHAKTIDGKAVESSYQVEAKNVGKANETSLLEQACAELESRANKKLDKGYVRTTAEATAPATNTLGLKRPMLATPLDKVKPESITWDQAFVQPKLDGHRCLFKDGLLYSREGKVIEMPHILKAIDALGMSHLHLDGELYIHGKSLQEIGSLIKRNQPGTEGIEYHVYDLIDESRFVSRVALLKGCFSGFVGVHGKVKLVYTIPVAGMNDVLEWHGQFRDKGYEGTMLRFSGEPYRDGKRSRTLLKIKEFQDAEFEIIGVEEGKPLIRGGTTWRVPVWMCDAGNGETFTATCQGDMGEKHAFWQTRHQYIGKKLTVKFHYYSEDGIPQLPVALRFYEPI